MPSPYRIVLASRSIFLLALEAAMLTLPEGEVCVLPPPAPITAESLVALVPDLVVLDSHAHEPALMVALLHGGISLLEIDGYGGHAYLLHGRGVTLTRLADLQSLLLALPSSLPFP